ncbi:hypothetical protein PFLG_01987 [Plasmodium falciparum RAJ116]|uniref:Uncharacterized protein n=1 Tax=Plasmodium falciparum RAJ116 TaxID=580058 RepID=A0A0L0CWK7_PLAFA|nr:hypothetical protein PFLG_01987 [Plasmodium falciparum RAJ116]
MNKIHNNNNNNNNDIVHCESNNDNVLDPSYKNEIGNNQIANIDITMFKIIIRRITQKNKTSKIHRIMG